MIVPREMEQPDLRTRTDLVVEEVVEDVVNDDVDVQKDVAFYVGRSELTLVDSVKENVEKKLQIRLKDVLKCYNFRSKRHNFTSKDFTTSVKTC